MSRPSKTNESRLSNEFEYSRRYSELTSEQAENKRRTELGKKVKDANHAMHLANTSVMNAEKEWKEVQEKLAKAKKERRKVKQKLLAAIHKQNEFDLQLANTPEASMDFKSRF